MPVCVLVIEDNPEDQWKEKGKISIAVDFGADSGVFTAEDLANGSPAQQIIGLTGQQLIDSLVPIDKEGDTNGKSMDRNRPGKKGSNGSANRKQCPLCGGLVKS